MLCWFSRTGTNACFYVWRREWFKVECQRIRKSLKLIRKCRRIEERLNQSLLRRRGNLGHKAKLAHSGRIISLMKYHYFSFVSWNIINRICSAFNPPRHTQPRQSLTNTWADSAQVEGASQPRWKVTVWIWALPWQVWLKRFQSQWELFQSAVLGSSPAHIKHIQTLCFSAETP